MNISDLIDQYEQGAKLRGLGPTQMTALRPVRRGLGMRLVTSLKPKCVSDYVWRRRNGQHSKVHGGRTAKDGTIRRELGALAAVLNWAHQKRILKDAPPSIDLPPMSPPREVFLNKEEADRLWDFASLRASFETPDMKRTALFACLALDTWARANAIETLTWGRVAPGQIDYRDPSKRATSKRRVPVPISSRLAPVLAMEALPEGLVCGRITQYMWKRFTAEAGIPHITRHDLRRTGISLAVARGVDLMKIAQMAGDNYETVIKHYARFAPDYLDGVVE